MTIIDPPTAIEDQDHRKPFDRNASELRNLYVASIPPHYNSTKLRELFRPYGDIFSARVIHDPVTNESKCYGFVMYETSEQAAAAVASLNGAVIERQYVLQVRLAHASALPSIAAPDGARRPSRQNHWQHASKVDAPPSYRQAVQPQYVIVNQQSVQRPQGTQYVVLQQPVQQPSATYVLYQVGEGSGQGSGSNWPPSSPAGGSGQFYYLGDQSATA